MVNTPIPTRQDYYRALADALPAGALVVTALGNASYLWAVVRDAPENFYLEDAMGLALPLALGLAVARPDRKVVVVEGDGGMLMHLGGLVTVGAVAPQNLTILLIQNGVHGASGGQSMTNKDLDFTALAAAVGLKQADYIESVGSFESGFAAAMEGPGPRLLALQTTPDLEVVIPPDAVDPVVIKRRFMAAIGAPRYVPTLFGGGMLERP